MSNLFTKEIKGFNFNFQPIEFGERRGYHVDVKDAEGTRWEFSILDTVSDDHALMIEGELLPEWILELEKDLFLAVNEHE